MEIEARARCGTLRPWLEAMGVEELESLWLEAKRGAYSRGANVFAEVLESKRGRREVSRKYFPR
jgi:hypothetical protein